jgi:hypothetical protein
MYLERNILRNCSHDPNFPGDNLDERGKDLQFLQDVP